MLYKAAYFRSIGKISDIIDTLEQNQSLHESEPVNTTIGMLKSLLLEMEDFIIENDKHYTPFPKVGLPRNHNSGKL